jgi:hypothetical protein
VKPTPTVPTSIIFIIIHFLWFQTITHISNVYLHKMVMPHWHFTASMIQNCLS